jgi:hypothetical protein
MRKKHGKAAVRVVGKRPDIPVTAVQYTITNMSKKSNAVTPTEASVTAYYLAASY